MNSEFCKIRVLLADDHPVVLKGFASSLADSGIDVAGMGRTPDDAVRLYDELQPDVAVLDIRFGEPKTGLDTARQILAKHPQARIVFLSQFDDDSLIRETYRIGAKAFITKDRDTETLVKAVQQAHAGEVYFLPEIAERLAKLSIGMDMSPQSILNTRELAIFTLMAQGYTNAEIAQKMILSPKTISNTSQAVKEKLGMHRQADLTRLAVKHGLIEA